MTNMNFDVARFNMIEQQIRTWEVLDNRVLEVMQKIPREMFVPDNYQQLAFADIEIPLPAGQTMLAPKVVGRILQALDINPDDRILEIGTGSGYLTACLSQLGNAVISVEINEEIHRLAQRNLDKLDINNVTLKVGDAADGWTQDASFDVIVVTASLPFCNNCFGNMLQNSGRLFVVIGKEPTMDAKLVTHIGNKDFREETLFETCIPAIKSTVELKEFIF